MLEKYWLRSVRIAGGRVESREQHLLDLLSELLKLRRIFELVRNLNDGRIVQDRQINVRV